MDSGNSGSLQSSSEAEEECDSRATNNNQPQQPAPRFNHHLIFDQNQINDNNIINPFFFTPNPQQHNQLVNLDSVIWSKTLPSFSDHDHFPTATITTEPIPPLPPPRNPKKRSRASRRAPTTVLTTDTSNFRAMVQEFTGIPSPPFTSSSSSNVLFPRLMTSFDLFGRPSTNNNNNNFDNLSQLPSNYLIKPSPSSLLDSSNLLINSMQSLPSSSSINHSLLFLNPKSTQNIGSSNGFGVMGQNQVHEPMPTSTKTRNDDQEIIEPWVCPSD
ncbi:VQ motif-containing protein [Tanacetum coccineum]